VTRHVNALQVATVTSFIAGWPPLVPVPELGLLEPPPVEPDANRATVERASRPVRINLDDMGPSDAAHHTGKVSGRDHSSI
jgi:hypothetical protein